MRVMWIHEDIDQAKPFYLDSDDCEFSHFETLDDYMWIV